MRTTGTYERTTTAGEAVDAFVPHPLPVSGPPISITGQLQHRIQAVEQALQRLELAAALVPSLDRFLYAASPSYSRHRSVSTSFSLLWRSVCMRGTSYRRSLGQASTRRQRGRSLAYHVYLETLQVGTELQHP